MIKVFGDIMLDIWINGEINRISPEAPVPVFLENSNSKSIGGAANLALNINKINPNVKLFGLLGDDVNGSIVIDLIKRNNLKYEIDFSKNPTTTKTRFINKSSKHFFRWDIDSNNYLLENHKKLDLRINKEDIICVSDYNKGFVTKELLKLLRIKHNKILVDPKQDANFYKDVFLVKPNMKEYNSWFGKFNKSSAIKNMNKLGWKWLVVTDGAKGMHVLNSDGDYKYFFEPVNDVIDVTGAGDAVMAVLACCVSKNIDIFQASKLACYAAARTVEKERVALINKGLLKDKTIFTNGVFDIIHKGHIELLKYAKTLGSNLIIGINSDKSVKRLKGKSRPINNQKFRKSQLLKFKFVDQVIIFDEDTPYEQIKLIKPDIIVKGGDYKAENVVGNDIAKVIIFPTLKGYSTTNIIKNKKK